ncbi:hypothetical protein [Aurantiacibacter flavus]
MTTPVLAPTESSSTGETYPADVPPAAEAQSTIIVTGLAQKLYRVEEITFGKLATSPLQASQVITTITEQLIEDQRARCAGPLSQHFGGWFLQLRWRHGAWISPGRDLYNGLRGDPYTGFPVPQLFNVERVEFLKGPPACSTAPARPAACSTLLPRSPTSAALTDRSS